MTEAPMTVPAESSSLNHGLRNQIQDKGPRQNAADNVRCNVRQTELFGDPGHQETGGQHQGNRNDCNRNRRITAVQPIHPYRQRKLTSGNNLKKQNGEEN